MAVGLIATSGLDRKTGGGFLSESNPFFEGFEDCDAVTEKPPPAQHRQHHNYCRRSQVSRELAGAEPISGEVLEIGHHPGGLARVVRLRIMWVGRQPLTRRLDSADLRGVCFCVVVGVDMLRLRFTGWVRSPPPPSPGGAGG